MPALYPQMLIHTKSARGIENRISQTPAIMITGELVATVTITATTAIEIPARATSPARREVQNA